MPTSCIGPQVTLAPPARGSDVTLAAHLGIPVAPAPAPQLVVSPNPLTETWRNIGFARENRTVFLSILGISWFWLYGALFLAQFPAFAKNVIGGGEGAVTLLLATFTIGIGIGSLLCERMSAKHVELGLVPFGSIGLTLFGLDLGIAAMPLSAGPEPLAVGALLAHGSTWRILFDLFMIGLFGGFFIVPLYALVQLRSAPEQRARIIAANNIMNALFMVVGAAAAAGLLGAGLSIPVLFAVAAVCNAAVALFIYGLVPEFLLRFLAWLLIPLVATALGIAWGRISPDLRGLAGETMQLAGSPSPLPDFECVVELTHRFSLRPGWSVQPDVQWILHPGGSGATPDAVVLGLEGSVTDTQYLDALYLRTRLSTLGVLSIEVRR